MTFARPAAARTEGDLRFQDLEGALLILNVTGVQANIPSASGEPFNAVVADVSVVDGPHAGTTHPGMWLIGAALQNQLGPHVDGPPVLGRLIVPPGKRYRMVADYTAEDEAAAVAAFPEHAATAPESDTGASDAVQGSLTLADDTPPF